MSRIASYPIQSIIIGADKVIGTDALNNSATKNFTFDDVAVFLNTSNKIEVNALRYSYQNHVAGTERKKGTISFSITERFPLPSGSIIFGTFIILAAFIVLLIINLGISCFYKL